MRPTLSVPAGLLLLAGPAFAQFDDQWVEFAPQPGWISSPVVSSSDLETDLAWGDLDQNGLTDLVVARIQPIMQGGKRTNLLLMNENGVLTDRTLEFASASDVVGDQGFLTPTADRDVAVADLNGDGWLDVVTAVGFGLVAEPVPLSHPRVYINLGADGSGAWLGLRYEQARIPVLLNGVTGLPVAARFNSVSTGDVNDDGFPDLYFGDHDASPTSIFGGEPATLDTDDRLFLNDGNGFFTDTTATSMTAQMVDSNFANSSSIADFNQDGVGDVLKQTNGVPGGGAAATIAYGDPAAPGTFSGFQPFYSGSPYFVSRGDLNGDGRLDVLVSENGNDGVVYNRGNDASGQVDWSPLVPFDFLSGGDDSFASNNLVVDLDGDGLQDALVTDVDPQFSGFTRRLHIYHNRGNNPGGSALLREERESTSNQGWIGAVGLTTQTLRGTHDVAVFDIDGDGFDDLIVSRNAGTQVYGRVTVCQPDLGFGSPGLELEVCGDELSSGNQSSLTLSGATPSTPALLIVSTLSIPTFIPELQATVAAFPPTIVSNISTDGNGEFKATINGGNGPTSVFVQFAVVNGLPTLFSLSNAVEIELLP